MEVNAIPLIINRKVPTLQLYYDLHIEACGEFLPTLYFGTAMVKLVQKLYRYSVANPKVEKAPVLISEILQFIEDFANDPNPRIQDVIRTGFAEGLWISGGDYDAIYFMTGSTTKKMILEIEAADGGKPALTAEEIMNSEKSYQNLDKIIARMILQDE